jgi:predicted polyphosphate/ATP-dependent NAD kinase
MRRIAVTGGRDFGNLRMVMEAFDEVGLCKDDVLVHGGCRGADDLCARTAYFKYNAKTEAYYADWKKYGRAAGPKRNREMLESGIDLLIAFPGGKGTFNCVMTARGLGIPVLEVGGEYGAGHSDI